MSTTASTIILNYICPIGGVTLANLMFSAPIKSLYDRIPLGSLGPLNATPWAFMTGNCLGWVAYSFLRQDPFILVGNAPGFIMSIWLNITASKLIYEHYSRQQLRKSMPGLLEKSHRMSLAMATAPIIHVPTNAINSQGKVKSQDDTTKDNITPIDNKNDGNMRSIDIEPNEEPVPAGLHQIWEQTLDLLTLEKAPVAHEYMVLGILTAWLLALSLVAFIPSSLNVKSATVGFIVNGNLLFFYGGPLSTMFHVLKTRDSSSIHRRTMIMNTLNGAFWTAYGIGIMDYYMFIPNGIGTLLGVVQFVLCVLFPSKDAENSKTPDSSEAGADIQASGGDGDHDEAVLRSKSLGHENNSSAIAENHHVEILGDSPTKSSSTNGDATGSISLDTVDMH